MANYCSRDFTEVVTIERASEVSDGFGGFSSSWTTLTTIYCMIETQSGSESYTASRLETNESMVLTCHYRSDLLASDRVVVDGQYGNINRIENVDRRSQFLKIYVELGVRT